MEITQIKRVSMADMACDEIQRRIKAGEWAVGDRLPAESELASMFGVNRLTVRMALQKLNTLGVVETRTGSGTFVVPFDFNNHIEDVSNLYMEPELLDNVQEFRSIIELECVRLACQRRTEEELEELKSLLDNYSKLYSEYAVDPDNVPWTDCVKADLAFHRQVVKMAHNKLLEYSFTVAQQSIYQYIVVVNHQRTMNIQQKSTQASIYEHVHEDIYNGIKNHDEEKSCNAHLHMIKRETAN